jgi:hypothetical protein
MHTSQASENQVYQIKKSIRNHKLYHYGTMNDFLSLIWSYTLVFHVSRNECDDVQLLNPP